MGLILLQGDIGGLDQDYDQAFFYFKMATENGNPTAMSHLAYMYQNGYGTLPDNITAKALYEKAALSDSAIAQTQLGILYLNGWGGVEQDSSTAKYWFEKAAEKNEPEALLYLGNMAFTGQGVQKSTSRARSFFMHSAQSGNLAAMYNLGVMFSNGYGGVRASCSTAIVYFRKILELSLLKTASNTAYKYYTKGIYDKALILYELAADQGDVLAQMNVAWLYEMGIGAYNLVSKELSMDKAKEEFHKRALEFYIRAAEQESPEAHLKVGDYYYYGWAGPANLALAADYYREASDLQNAQATFNLGWMYQYGVGLDRDPHLAKRNYDLSIELDSESNIPSSLALATLQA
jgi:SEL1 protein